MIDAAFDEFSGVDGGDTVSSAVDVCCIDCGTARFFSVKVLARHKRNVRHCAKILLNASEACLKARNLILYGVATCELKIALLEKLGAITAILAFGKSALSLDRFALLIEAAQVFIAFARCDRLCLIELLDSKLPLFGGEVLISEQLFELELTLPSRFLIEPNLPVYGVLALL